MHTLERTLSVSVRTHKVAAGQVEELAAVVGADAWVIRELRVEGRDRRRNQGVRSLAVRIRGCVLLNVELTAFVAGHSANKRWSPQAMRSGTSRR